MSGLAGGHATASMKAKVGVLPPRTGPRCDLPVTRRQRRTARRPRSGPPQGVKRLSWGPNRPRLPVPISDLIAREGDGPGRTTILTWGARWHTSKPADSREDPGSCCLTSRPGALGSHMGPPNSLARRAMEVALGHIGDGSWRWAATGVCFQRRVSSGREADSGSEMAPPRQPGRLDAWTTGSARRARPRSADDALGAPSFRDRICIMLVQLRLATELQGDRLPRPRSSWPWGPDRLTCQ